MKIKIYTASCTPVAQKGINKTSCWVIGLYLKELDAVDAARSYFKQHFPNSNIEMNYAKAQPGSPFIWDITDGDDLIGGVFVDEKELDISNLTFLAMAAE